MVLTTSKLKKRLVEVFNHGDHSLIGPASVDLRVGRLLLAESTKEGLSNLLDRKHQEQDWVKVSLDNSSEEFPYWLQPWQFVLVETLEFVNVPDDLVMELKLKSSIARDGYNHLLALWVDPGFSGILTLEIYNVRARKCLPLWKGMRIVQAALHTLQGEPELYHGRYQNADEVQFSKPDSR